MLTAMRIDMVVPQAIILVRQSFVLNLDMMDKTFRVNPRTHVNNMVTTLRRRKHPFTCGRGVT